MASANHMRDILDQMHYRIDEKGALSRSISGVGRAISKHVGDAKRKSGNAVTSAKGDTQVKNVDDYRNYVDAFTYTWGKWANNTKDTKKWPNADRKNGKGPKLKTLGNLALYLYGLGLGHREIKDFFEKTGLNAVSGLKKIESHLNAKQSKDTNSKGSESSSETNTGDEPSEISMDDLGDMFDSDKPSEIGMNNLENMFDSNIRVPNTTDSFILLEFITLLENPNSTFNLKSVADDFATWSIEKNRDFLGVDSDFEDNNQSNTNAGEFSKDLNTALQNYGTGNSKKLGWVRDKILPNTNMPLLQKINKLYNEESENPEEDLNHELTSDEKNNKYIQFGHILLGMYKSDREKYGQFTKIIMKDMLKSSANKEDASNEIVESLKDYLSKMSGSMKNNAYELGTARKIWAFGYSGARYINDNNLYGEQ